MTARDWLRAGKNHYNLGEFDRAIEAFKEAYKLEPNSALLLNIAQAYRMAGDCPRALLSYKAFIRNGGDEEAVRLAAEHEANLSRQCGPAVIAKTNETAEIPRPAKIASLAAIGIGASTLVLSSVVFIWNEGRASRWQAEDQDLRGSAASGTVISKDLESRQNRNDQLLSAIRHTDRVCLTMLAGGAIFVSVGIAIRYVSPMKPSVSLGLNSVAVRFAF